MILFFKRTLENHRSFNINKRYKYLLFKPSMLKILPNGIKVNLGFILWWLYSFLWRIQKKEYEFHLLYDDNVLVHYSVVLPKYYRFPFMGKQDIQIGPCWTHEQYRGQGLYPYILTKIVNKFTKGGKRNVWIICKKDNIRSIKGILKSKFYIVGSGERTKYFGLKFLGKYELQEEQKIQHFEGH